MHEHERKIRPALAIIVLVCFFMPFMKVSCGGQPILSVTGLDLATGKDVKPDNPWADNKFAEAYRNDQPDQAQPPDSVWNTVPMDESNPMEQFGGMQGMNGKVTAEPAAAAALILAGVALLAAFPGTRKAMTVSAVTAGLCTVSLLILKSQTGGELPPEAAAIIAVEWTNAFWVALVGSGILSVFTVHLLTKIDPQYTKPKIVIQSYHEEKVAP